MDGRGREGEWGAAEGATFLTDSDELRQNQGTVKTNKMSAASAASVCVCVSGAEWMSAAMHPGGVPFEGAPNQGGVPLRASESGARSTGVSETEETLR